MARDHELLIGRHHPRADPTTGRADAGSAPGVGRRVGLDPKPCRVAAHPLAELPLAIARALEKADWPLVKELSQRTEALKQAVEGKSKLIETARGVYAVTDVRLDPFCHSLQRFTGVLAADLPRLRTSVVERLTTLEQSDVSWRDFYAGRRAAFETRAPTTSKQVSDDAAI